ncbi:MAG: 7-cyano-7-deazaguanine synthase [Gemmatales bacterium]|nr:7-cyano-7-deazaguanine synthase [Gemmatales bacterium]MDW8385742.1 7-cyano-7-deazaguanine synthase [Gemmatales bacterium]
MKHASTETDTPFFGNQQAERDSCAVLVSGGLDSAVLAVEMTTRFASVYPIYIRSGLTWEETELAHLRQFLHLTNLPMLRQLVLLHMPVADLYGNHWSLTGRDVPDADSEDSAVFLPGRNLLLLLKAMLWCRINGVSTLALGILRGNPFPDATPAFFGSFQGAVNRGIDGNLSIVTPFSTLDKVSVIQRGATLPLQSTFSCIQPRGGLHCGRCNKCAERQRAFRAAGVPDPTRYA